MTTSKNFQELKLGFEQEILPTAFRDAATLAQSLRISYLWIDTLCIIQDSDVDWAEQAAKMGEVFEGATITIAASSSVEPYQTLFQDRLPQYQEFELNSEATKQPNVMFRARRKLDRGIHAKTGRTDSDPLDKRAWALQEKMLSSRLIAFTGAELQWTCRTLRACECHQNPYPSQPLFTALAETSGEEMIMKYSRTWSQVIEEYSTRKLTIQEDMLPALSGLARAFGNVTGFKYVGGLWKESLLYDLVWQRDIEPLVIHRTWLAPSFSWASAPGAVNFRFARHSYPGRRISHITLIESYYKTSGTDTYSRAMDGRIVVRGHTVVAGLRKLSSTNPEAYALCIEKSVYVPSTDQVAVCEFSIDTCIPDYNAKKTTTVSETKLCDTTFEDTSQVVEEPVILLSLYSIHDQRYLYQNFLILAQSQQDHKVYKRIGVGSGKLYRGQDCHNKVPSEARYVRPFEWLSINLGERCHAIKNVAEQTVCIQ
jgi:hypothetical protein